MNTITYGHKVTGVGIEPIPPYSFIQGGKAQWQRSERSSVQSGAVGSEIWPQGGKGVGWSTDDEHERVVVLS